MSADKIRFTKAEQDRFMDRIVGLRARTLALYASPRVTRMRAMRIAHLFNEWQRRWSPRGAILLKTA